jgi:uncharacterized membrane protein YvbJ
MALIQCNKCGNQVSDLADNCPHCKAEIRNRLINQNDTNESSNYNSTFNELLVKLGNNVASAGIEFLNLTKLILVSFGLNIVFYIYISYLKNRFLQNPNAINDLRTALVFFALSNLIFFSLSIWTLYKAGQSLKNAFRK